MAAVGQRLSMRAKVTKDTDNAPGTAAFVTLTRLLNGLR